MKIWSVKDLKQTAEAIIRDDEGCGFAEAVLARDWLLLNEVAEAARKWLQAYDDTGPNNGPSLVEQDCATEMIVALEKLDAAREAK